jgi:hypothetical protein
VALPLWAVVLLLLAFILETASVWTSAFPIYLRRETRRAVRRLVRRATLRAPNISCLQRVYC